MLVVVASHACHPAGAAVKFVRHHPVSAEQVSRCTLFGGNPTAGSSGSRGVEVWLVLIIGTYSLFGSWVPVSANERSGLASPASTSEGREESGPHRSL